MAVMNLPTVKDKPNSMLTGLASVKSAFSPRVGGGQPYRQNQQLPLTGNQEYYKAAKTTQSVVQPTAHYASDDSLDFNNWRRMRSESTRQADTPTTSAVTKWSLLGASFAVLSGLILSGGFAYSQIIATKPQAAGNVAGAVSTNEALSQEQIDMVVAAVRSGAVGTISSKQGQPADLTDTPAISRVVSPENVRRQNPVFFARVQEGDLLVKFQQYTALYRPSSKEIIAQGSLRVN